MTEDANVKFSLHVQELYGSSVDFCYRKTFLLKKNLSKLNLSVEYFYIFADPTSRGKAICKCKKLAYQRAVENAFSRVLLLVLSNGKVAVEVDTTRPELMHTEKMLNDKNLLKASCTRKG